ncbi:MAG TPA: MSMEG_4193 family putative phosphomutase [Anaerolineaceae bacterium]
MTAIFLVRHGENDFVGKRLAGRLPGVHLNQRGKEQAHMLVDRLKQAPLKAIYSSPLERAVETATPLAVHLGLSIQPAPGLIELDYGEWQGAELDQLRTDPLWKKVQNTPSQVCFPGGENLRAVQQRAVEEIERIASLHDERDMIACFSHGDIIRLLLAYYLVMPLDEFQRLSADTASISLVFLTKDGIHVHSVNQAMTLDFQIPEINRKPEQK